MNIDQTVQERIFGYLDAIANKLGAAAEYVMAALVKQQVIAGTAALGVWVLIVLLDVVLIIGTVRAHKKHTRLVDEYYDDRNNRRETRAENACAVFMGLVVVSITLSIVLLIALAAVVPDAIGKILNPSYYALKDIVQAVK